MNRMIVRSLGALLISTLTIASVCAAQKPAGGARSVIPQADTDSPAERDHPENIRKRQDWFYHQRAYPLSHVPAEARLGAFRQISRMSTHRFGLQPSWALIGPQPTTGPLPYFPTSGR